MKHKPLGYQPMPSGEVRQRSGCKVGWYYYADEATAQRAAKIARHNAAIDAGQGYDFGYCSPGSVRKMQDGTYEVCVS